MSIDTGGSAFPNPPMGGFGPEAGMSLRDYFAGQALLGLLARPGLDGIGDVVRMAYEAADYAILERQEVSE